MIKPKFQLKVTICLNLEFQLKRPHGFIVIFANHLPSLHVFNLTKFLKKIIHD